MNQAVRKKSPWDLMREAVLDFVAQPAGLCQLSGQVMWEHGLGTVVWVTDDHGEMVPTLTNPERVKAWLTTFPRGFVDAHTITPTWTKDGGGVLTFQRKP